AERKNRYEMAIQATGQVLYDWNAKTNEVTWGGMLEQTLGYAPQEVSSQVAWWTGLIHPEDRPGFQEAFDRALATQTSSRLEYRVRKKDGTYITVEDTWYVVFDEASTVARLVGFVSDITARRRAEEEVQRLNAELEQHVIERTAQLETANKELEAFSYSVSHDLRAPLRAMDGFSRILLEDYAPQLTSDAARYLQMVRESAQRMGSLIDDLLTFSRLGRQPLTKQPVAPADLVRQTLTELRVEQENRRVEINLGELPLCQADPALLKQVFVNLLTNALKFTRRRELACIEIGCQQLNGDQIYFVKDNGVGFDMQYVHKLFGVFQRLHRIEDYEGTGVGLAIVQRILHRHGGRVWAEAAIDEGATFYFTVGEQQEQEA
ncbi:MAG: sensor histidine kinase, partial [Candidatus Binatia bacterium]